MKHIIYLSSAVGLFSPLGMRHLLAKSRSKNTLLGITGFLLYRSGNFLQILEGEGDEVDNVYERICQDPRHKGIIHLFNERVERREFPDWSMGFWDVGSSLGNNPDEVNQIVGSKSTDLKQFGFSPEVFSFIKTFLKG